MSEKSEIAAVAALTTALRTNFPGHDPKEYAGAAQMLAANFHAQHVTLQNIYQAARHLTCPSVLEGTEDLRDQLRVAVARHEETIRSGGK